MSTATDLEGMLRTDDDNLTLRLANWFASEGLTEHVKINVRFRAMGATAAERLHPEAIVVKPDPKGVDNLVDQIEEIVTDKLGTNPVGTLRVQGFPEGKSQSPPLDMTRTLQADGNGLSEPNLALVRGLHSGAERRIMHLESLLAQAFTSQGQTIAQLAQANATLATARTAGSTGNDLGSIGAVIGLVALIVLLPMIKRELGLPPDATISDVLAAMRGVTNGLLDPSPAARKPSPATSPIPPGAIPPARQLEAAPSVTGDASSGTGNGSPAASIPPDPAQLVEWFRKDRAGAMAALGQLLEQPDIRAAAIEAAAAAQVRAG